MSTKESKVARPFTPFTRETVSPIDSETEIAAARLTFEPKAESLIKTLARRAGQDALFLENPNKEYDSKYYVQNVLSLAIGASRGAYDQAKIKDFREFYPGFNEAVNFIKNNPELIVEYMKDKTAQPDRSKAAPTR